MAAYAAKCMAGKVDQLGSGFSFEVRLEHLSFCPVCGGWRGDSCHIRSTALRSHDPVFRLQGGPPRLLQRPVAAGTR
jgi:hypothetical protein